MSDNHESEGLVSTEHEAHEQLLSEDPSAYLGTLEQDGASLCEECLQYFLENISLADLEPEERTEVLVELAEYAEYNPALFNRLSPKLEDLSQEDIDTLAREEPGAAFSLFVEVSDDGALAGKNLGSNKFLPLQILFREDVAFMHNDSYFEFIDGMWEVTYQGGRGREAGYRTPGVGDGLWVQLERRDVIERFQEAEQQIEAMEFTRQVELLLDIEQYINEGVTSENLHDFYSDHVGLLTPRSVSHLMARFPEQALFLFVANNPEAAENLFTTSQADGSRQVRFFGNGALNRQLRLQHFLADRPENNYLVTRREGVDRYWGRTLNGYQFLGQFPAEPADPSTRIGDLAAVFDRTEFRTMSVLPAEFSPDVSAQAIIDEFVNHESRSDLEANRRANFLSAQSLKYQATNEFLSLSEYAISNGLSAPYHEALSSFEDSIMDFRGYLDGRYSDEGFQIGAENFVPIDYSLGTAEFEAEARQAYQAARAQLEADLQAIEDEDPEQGVNVIALRSEVFRVEQGIRSRQRQNFEALRDRSESALEDLGFAIDQLPENADYSDWISLVNNSENLSPETAIALQNWRSLDLTITGIELAQDRSVLEFELASIWSRRPPVLRDWSNAQDLIAYYENNRDDVIFSDDPDIQNFVNQLREADARLEEVRTALTIHEKEAAASTDLYQALGEGRENFVAEIQRRANTARYHQSVSETGALVIEKSAVSLAQVQQSQEGLVGLIDGDIERTDTGYRFRVKGSEEDAWIEANLQTDEMTPAKFLDSPYRQAFSAGIDSSNLPYMQILTTVGGESTFFPQATTEHDLTGLGGWELEKLFRNLYPIGRAELDGNTIAGWRRALEIYDGFPGLLAAVQSQGQSEQANLPDLVDERGNLHSENTRFYTIYFERILSGSRVTSMA